MISAVQVKSCVAASALESSASIFFAASAVVGDIITSDTSSIGFCIIRSITVGANLSGYSVSSQGFSAVVAVGNSGTASYTAGLAHGSVES